MIINGRTLVPVRAIFEVMGATVEWDAEANSVKAKKDTKTVVLRPGDRQATIDDMPCTLDVPAQVVDGRTLVPLRFVSEVFGAEVTWNPSSRVIHINRK